MSLGANQKRDTATWQIIEFMQRNGSATIKDLEQLLGITTTAVRQHLNTLQVEGYIERKTSPPRPTKFLLATVMI